MGALTVLNEAGDVTLVWDESGDDAMRVVIEAKLAQGFTFYIIEPRLGGLAAPRKKPLKDFDAALEQRALAIPDAEFMRFVAEGHGEVVKSPAVPVKGAKRSRAAKEIVKTESVALKPRKGG